MEWAKDGRSGELFIVQARPETVQARRPSAELKTYSLERKGKLLLSAAAVGEPSRPEPCAACRARRRSTASAPGSILVTEITDPDWVPIMKRAAAIVTDHGGRTSHAAIVSRELGLPAIVGTGNATRVLRDGQRVTVSCAEGDDRRGLRRHRRSIGREPRSLRRAEDAYARAVESREPRCGAALVAAAGGRRRPCEDRVHRDARHRNPSAGAAAAESA